MAVVGSSGSGKSTLLHLLGGLDVPSAGRWLLGRRTSRGPSRTPSGAACATSLGFIYQFHHLLGEFSALGERGDAALRAAPAEGRGPGPGRRDAEGGGLGHREHTPGGKLSAASASGRPSPGAGDRPACVLADEPTGNLDRQTAEKVFALMLELAEEQGTRLRHRHPDPQLAAGPGARQV